MLHLDGYRVYQDFGARNQLRIHLSIPRFRRFEQRYRIHPFPPSSSQRTAGEEHGGE
jgi:hypothetical protein